MAFDLGVARGRIEIDTNDLNRVSTALTGAGLGFMAVGAAAVGGFAMAVSASAGFEEKLSHIGAVTGATEEDIDRLRQASLKLGQDTAYGATQAAGAFVELAKAGLSVQQILDGAGDAAVQLAAAGDIPIAQAAETAVNIMQTFNMEASEMVHIADVLAGAANASTVEIEDLAVSFKYAGSVASALGISLEDTATAMAILGNNGIKGSTAGTSLRRIMLQLSPTTEKAAGVMKELGLITEDGSNKFYDAQGNAKGLGEIFAILGDATKNLNAEQKATALATIFGARAVSSGLILMREGAQGFNEVQTQIGKVTALEVMEKRLDNVAGAWKKLKAAIETFLITGGGPFQDTIQKIIEGITGLFNWFSRLPTPVIVIVTVLTLLVGLLAILAGGFLLTAGVMFKAYTTFVQLLPAMRAVVGVARLMTTAFLRMAASLLTNPVFLIIAAIVALGIALFVLYKKSEAFRNFIDGLWQGIQKGWDAILNFFRGIPKWFQDRWDELKGGIDRFVKFVKQNWDLLLIIFTGPFGVIVTIIRRFGDDIVRFVSTAVDAVVDFFQKLPGRVIGAVSAFIGRVIHEFSQMPNRIAFILGFIIGRFLRFLADMVMLAVEWVPKIFFAIVDWFEQLPGRIIGFFDNIWDSIYAWFTKTSVDVAVWAKNVFDAIVNWFEQLPGKVIGFFDSIWDGLYAWSVRQINSMKEWAEKIFNSLIDWIKKTPGEVGRWFEQLPGKILGFVDRMWDAAWEVGANVINGLKDGVGDLGKWIVDAFWAVIHGIAGFADKAWDKAWDVGKSLVNGFKKGLGIGSPSELERTMWKIQDNVAKSVVELGAETAMVHHYADASAKSFQSLGSITVPGNIAPPTATAATTPPDTISGLTIENIEINNPIPETTDASLTRTMQKLEYAGYVGK